MLTPNQRLTAYMRQAGVISPDRTARFYTNNPFMAKMTPRQRRRVIKKAMSNMTSNIGLSASMAGR